MARFGLVSGSYRSQSPADNLQTTINWYVEADESGHGKSGAMLYPFPGTRIAYSLAGPSVRGMIRTASQGGFPKERVFAVSGAFFYELLDDGTKTIRNPSLYYFTGNDPVSMAASSTQILIIAGLQAYCYDLQIDAFVPLQTVDPSTGALSPGSGMLPNPIQCGYSDGFFIVTFLDSQTIQCSNPLDASAWDPTQISIVTRFSDNIVSMLVDHDQIWLWGSRQTQPYYTSGNVFPFDPVPGGFIEQGCAATFSPVRLDNSVFWLGQDERGAMIAWRANGYTPQRVSNHNVEWEWMNAPAPTPLHALQQSDAISYAWQYSGHSFWQIYFPTAGKTWYYDAESGLWGERSTWNVAQQAFIAHCSQNHVFAFQTQLIGDWNTGNVYATNAIFADDAGQVIERVRISPYISIENDWVFHHQINLDVEVGLGPQPPLVDGNGNPRPPQIILSWSDDQGKTWSNDHFFGCGFAGQYRTRVIARRLGRSRGRVYKIVATDPIPWRIIDAYLTASPGFETTERLVSKLGKET